jgi:chorismate-pyruvate lyase
MNHAGNPIPIMPAFNDDLPTSVPITAFADTRTRMLLSNNGSTTKLLEAALHTTITVQVDYQHSHPAADLSGHVRQALGLAEHQHATIRQSTLLTAEQQPISSNRVIIGARSDDHVHRLTTSPDLPLGLALIGAEVEQCRRGLTIGHHPWPHSSPPRPAASKTYVIIISGHPCLHLHETYSPDLFPAELRSA